MKSNLCVKSVSLIALFLFAACGSETSSVNGGDPLALKLKVDDGSYLPLRKGITTTFADGSIEKDGDISVENLTVSVVDDGIVKITGRKINSQTGETIDIEENLTFQEEGDQILLTKYSLDSNSSLSGKFSNNRVYDPPVIFLKDKTSLSEGALPTENLTVKYEGAQSETVELADVNDGLAFDVAGYNNITANVEYSRSVYVGYIELASTDSYTIQFQPDIQASGVWYPKNGLVNGKFNLSQGVGIVELAGRSASQTNVYLGKCTDNYDCAVF